MNIQIDDSLLNTIEQLNKEYKEIYGKEVDYTVIPKGITQEILVDCLQLMISNNLSLITAYTRIKKGKSKWATEK